MAARRRSHKTNDLPPNLYCRNGYYSFRDPRTGKEYGLGRDKRYAVNEAVAANMTMIPEKTASLADRISGKETLLFDDLIRAFEQDLSLRKLSEKTKKENKQRIKTINNHFTQQPVDKIFTKEIHQFLNLWIEQGKTNYANVLRTMLSDIFKTAIANGLVLQNPVAHTRPAKNDIDKDRLILEEYLLIRKYADKMPGWVGLSLDLALVTGQRVSDLAKMKWSDISDNKLNVVQQKTKKMLRISLENGIDQFDMTLSSVLDKLKKLHDKNEYILGGRSSRAISDAYRRARDNVNIQWIGKPAPFHEIRSLSGRLYLKQKNIEFAQNILGHNSLDMTNKYIDGRGKDWVDI